MTKIPIYNEEWLASSQCLFSVHYSCHTQHISGKYYFFTRFTYECKHVSYMNIQYAGSLLLSMRSKTFSGVYNFLMSTDIQRKSWGQMSKFIFRFLEETTDIPNGATIVFFFPCVFFHPVSLQWRPRVSKPTQKYTDTHQDMHNCTFGQDFSPYLLSICGVFKHQSRVV